MTGHALQKIRLPDLFGRMAPAARAADQLADGHAPPKFQEADLSGWMTGHALQKIRLSDLFGRMAPAARGAPSLLMAMPGGPRRRPAC
jgi:hypothetical protein